MQAELELPFSVLASSARRHQDRLQYIAGVSTLA